MFWLIDNNRYDIDFYQIFTDFTKYNSNSVCYDFNKQSTVNFDFTKYKNTLITCDIYLKGSLIQYINNKDNNIYTFIFQEEFIKETDVNILNLPMFLFKYKNTENNRLPNLNKNNYDFYYENISFNIYDISDNTLFVEQKFNDKTKIYFITTDCSEIKKLLN
jgi:hypothetical protein